MDTQLHYAHLYSKKEVGSLDFSIWQVRTYSDLAKEDLVNKVILEV